MLDEDVPAKNAPDEDVPAETHPAETHPTQTQPTETRAAETEPAEARPTATLPAGNVPHGSAFDELAGHLRDEHQAGDVRECVCRSCGGLTFEVAVMEVEGGARRTCLGCGAEEYVADSADYWDDDAEVDYYCACPCGHEEFTAAVGYLIGDDGEVRWIFVGLRCLACASLNVYEDWKISYGPTRHLLDMA